jgi:putative ABC transport system permease protein
MQAAVPAIEINRLQSLMGSGTAVLRILGWLLAALAACSIFVMLVQGTHERRYELALLRSMGFGRGKLLGLVLAEAAILGIAGIIGGFLLSRLSGWFLQQEVFSHYHLNFSGAWKITPADMITAVAILAACLLAALFPAIRAFRLNISKTLANA